MYCRATRLQSTYTEPCIKCSHSIVLNSELYRHFKWVKVVHPYSSGLHIHRLVVVSSEMLSNHIVWPISIKQIHYICITSMAWYKTVVTLLLTQSCAKPLIYSNGYLFQTESRSWGRLGGRYPPVFSYNDVSTTRLLALRNEYLHLISLDNVEPLRNIAG